MMKQQIQGFTLVEVVVTGSIAAVLAGLLLTTFLAYSKEFNDSMTTSMLNISANTVKERIMADVRRGQNVMGPGEDPEDEIPSLDSVQPHINIWDVDGVERHIAGYLIEGTTNRLRYYDTTSGNWLHFEIGGKPVVVSEGSRFILDDSRKKVRVKIGLKLEYNGQVDSMPPLSGFVATCRERE
ncbi:MAG: hypothetical protein GF398_12645 [Chitinivibrionales bacterium]|nr:hypothetical protein [Chitinivibrionales bacterium]